MHMNLTLEEQERMAYQQGNLPVAQALGIVADSIYYEHQVDEAHGEGYDEGHADGRTAGRDEIKTDLADLIGKFEDGEFTTKAFREAITKLTEGR